MTAQTTAFFIEAKPAEYLQEFIQALEYQFDTSATPVNGSDSTYKIATTDEEIEHVCNENPEFVEDYWWE